MKEIDDYELYDLDFEEWARRGRVAFGLEKDAGAEKGENEDGSKNKKETDPYQSRK